MQFEFYVLNYDCNSKKVINYNIFNNINVQECTEKAVRRYLQNPKDFPYVPYNNIDEIIYGFDALVKEIDNAIRWQEWSRREYEISVGDAFEVDCNKLEKWDCYKQAHANIEMITREVIYQYKQQIKEDNKDES